MTDDRSERLRRRRKRSTEQAGPREGRESNSSKLDKLSESSESEGGAGDDEQETPVKEKQRGTYMYLPEAQTKEMKRLYNVLKAEYEFEFDDEFEKNRHFYPLVVQYGLDGLDEMDTFEIRDRLEEYYE